MIDEGFATFIADKYWGVGLSPAEALGRAAEQWAWAVDNERAQWREAQAPLESTDRKVLNRFSAAGQHVIPGSARGFQQGEFVGRRRPQGSPCAC